MALEQPPAIEPLLPPDTNDVNTTIVNLPTPDNKQEQQQQQQHQQPQQQQQQQSTEPSTPQKTIVTKVKLSDELNIFDWFRTTDILNQIAERARHSLDTVITALDPGMKEYLFSGGNINIMVICDSENIISAIRDSFQSAFGRATVNPARYVSPEAKTEYPIKLASGLKEAIQVANERIKRLRLGKEMVPQNQVVVVVQPCLIYLDKELQNVVEGGDQSNVSISPRCHLTYCMLIEDPVLMTTMSSYSHFIPIDEDIVAIARQAQVSNANFHDQSHLGFAISIEEIMNSKLNLRPTVAGELEDCQWLKIWAGLSESQMIRDLSSALALSYRRKWDECVNQ